jgi:oligopeptide transport system substrate-binding protein
MKKLRGRSLVLATIATLFAGCAGGSSSGSSTPASSAASSTASSAAESAAEPGALKEISVNTGSEPPQMNSILTTSTGSMNVLRHIVDGLTMLDQNDEPAPAVAESWTVSEDGKTYTFKLRQGMKWSNGEDVTANDFIFAWDQHFTAEVAAPYAGTWAKFFLGATEKLEGTPISAETQAALDAGGYTNGVGFKAIDDYTIQVTTTNPYPFFLSVLAFPSFMPVNQKAYEEIGAAAYGTEAANIVTNGAWNITSWTHEDNIVLEKNPNYWDAANIKIDKITMVMINDTTTALNAFVAEELDMVGLNGQQAQQMRDEGRTVLSYDDGSAWYFEYQTTKPGLNNAKVRRALTLGVDAQSFITNVVQNDSSVAYSFTPSAIQQGKFTAAVGQVLERSNDYTAAKALLEEGLAEEGLTIDTFSPAIICDDTDTATRYSAFFQEQWKTNLGLNVTIDSMTYKNRLERMQNFDFDIVLAGWGPDYNDPMTFLDLFITGSGNNHTQYSNTEYDALVAQALAEPDAAKREQLLIQIENILLTDMPIGPIYNRKANYICSDRLTGVVRSTFSDMSFRYADVTA